jgi:hypothetical protein
MSKIIELAKLLPKGIKNPLVILEGYINNIKLERGDLPQDEVEEILRRRLICFNCPLMSENAKKLVGYKTDRGPHCTLCSCPIEQKTSSLDTYCGAKSYNESHPNSVQMEVKWGSYARNN